jgi:hypothetical protein
MLLLGCNGRKTRRRPRMDSLWHQCFNPKPWCLLRYSRRSLVLYSSLTIILTSNPYSRVIGNKTCSKIRRKKLRPSRPLRKILKILYLGDVPGSSWSRSWRPNSWNLNQLWSHSQLLSLLIKVAITRNALFCWYLHTERCFLRTWKRNSCQFLTDRAKARACYRLLTIRNNLNRLRIMVSFFLRMIENKKMPTQETTSSQAIGCLSSGIKDRPMMPPWWNQKPIALPFSMIRPHSYLQS